MHSRIFYYARIRGVTIPHAPYRAWLRRRLLSSSRIDQSSSSSPPPPRIWEWELLTALCNHRDRLAGASQSSAGAASADSRARDAAAATERDLWMRELLGAGSSGDDAAESTTPAWMAAAPRGDLYVNPRDAAAGAETAAGEGAGGQVPYPDQFAAIIKAVQSGERIEGIVEIPDVVVRNPVSFFPTPSCLATFFFPLDESSDMIDNRRA